MPIARKSPVPASCAGASGVSWLVVSGGMEGAAGFSGREGGWVALAKWSPSDSAESVFPRY